ncbi:MAG TPA: amylo-alpha-1,6-glucosidase [Bacteroidota bacterium]|nr:amylo-alpha-1,6-glucosidase [Bacteroidota bacterium]
MRQFFLLLLASSSLLAGTPLVDEIGIRVDGAGRQFCYTNKEAGTYYGEVNGRNTGGWQGWFVNAEKIVDDYSLELHGTSLDRSVATSTVFPYALVRRYPDGTVETFSLIDSLNAVAVEVSRPEGLSTAVSLRLNASDNYETKEPAEGVDLWARKSPPKDRTIPAWIALLSRPAGSRLLFVVAAATSKLQAIQLSEEVALRVPELLASRKERMEKILERSRVTTVDSAFDAALEWAKLSLDALIMNQAQSGMPVKGIFAGMPWFNDYWGRDSFISLPGATFITGDFADARKILLSFAKFQERDSTDPNFGRIPNIVTTNSVAFNTADGTPWFVKQLYDYVKYSGDLAILDTLFPVVRRSIEGTLKYHCDSLLFLTHGDAETWMDAVGPNGPWSPRGNRACDVQALWQDQLLIGSFIAEYLGEYRLAGRWKDAADTLALNFNRYFVDTKDSLVYDHLKKDGTPSSELRPNQLFCLDLVNSEDLREKIVKTVTEQLVTPYGVATLAPTDSNFHPFHHYEPYYVQDAAYHNGIIWTWLDGRALYALTRNDEEGLGFRVTEHLVDEILHRGCVGTLSELIDALPRPGETEPRLSGAFSQAWSLAEFIRSFYQDYLGISVDATSHLLRVNPKLPKAIGNVSFRIRVADAYVDGRCERIGDSVRTSLVPEALPRPYTVNYLWVYDNGDAAFLNASLMPAETLTIAHSLSACEVRSAGRLLGPQKGGIPWHLVHFSPKGAFARLSLARPKFDPAIPALRGPAYPTLTLDEVRATSSSADTLFDARDSTGDDRGPSGTYVYPASTNFHPGILDITRGVVRFDSTNVYFTLHFRNLTDPGWHPEYGFQLTFAVIALHRGDRGPTEVGYNSQVVLDSAFRYDRLIAIGGGVRLTDESGSVLCEYRPGPGDERNPIGNVAAKAIEFSLPLKYLGKPTSSWRMVVLVGAQDDHGGAGVGEFRGVEDTATEWRGGGKIRQADPNVYDILTLDH